MGAGIVWLIIMIPCSAIFTGLGIYAWRRKKPMWFWSGTTVKEEDIADIPAYNHANGIMWIAYSLIFWVATFIGLAHPALGGIVLIVGMVIATPLLVVTYNKIYKRYMRK